MVGEVCVQEEEKSRLTIKDAMAQHLAHPISYLQTELATGVMKLNDKSARSNLYGLVIWPQTSRVAAAYQSIRS